MAVMWQWDDLTLTVEPGKIYGFLGPNGAGKSTTMNMITGYLGATSGEIRLNGHDILAEPEEAKKCVGYLPEIPPLYVDMTVREYLNFVAELKQITRANRKDEVERALKITRTAEVSGAFDTQSVQRIQTACGICPGCDGKPGDYHFG